MRKKPTTLAGSTSDFMWADFNRFCDENGIGEHPDDWEFFWKTYFAGYDFRCAENVGACI